MPGDRVDDVLAHVRRAAGDTAVRVRLLSGTEASPVSAVGSASWTTLSRTVRAVWPDALVAPYLMTAATDARHWHALSRDVYRFMPMHATPADLQRIHGTDERVAVADYAAAVRFYAQLVRAMDR
jgi:carboxypeptidase PM20D1